MRRAPLAAISLQIGAFGAAHATIKGVPADPRNDALLYSSSPPLMNFHGSGHGAGSVRGRLADHRICFLLVGCHCRRSLTHQNVCDCCGALGALLLSRRREVPSLVHPRELTRAMLNRRPAQRFRLGAPVSIARRRLERHDQQSAPAAPGSSRSAMASELTVLEGVSNPRMVRSAAVPAVHTLASSRG
jgi:hypothetical protein